MVWTLLHWEDFHQLARSRTIGNCLRETPPTAAWDPHQETDKHVLDHYLVLHTFPDAQYIVTEGVRSYLTHTETAPRGNS